MTKRQSRRSSRGRSRRSSRPTRRFGNDLGDRLRARAIVSLAAAKVKDPNTSDWLRTDREGTWEKGAAEYLEKTRAKAEELGLSEQQVNSEIAIRLAYDALTAQIAHQKKKRGRK
jgi:hypothetical protein